MPSLELIFVVMFKIISKILLLPTVYQTAHHYYRITEQQSGWVWKWLLEALLLQLPAQEGPPRRGCSRPCSDNFKMSLRMEPLQCLWTTQSLSQQTTLSSCSAETSCFTLCPLLLAPSLGTTEKRLVLFLCPPSRYLFIFIRSIVFFSSENGPSASNISSYEILLMHRM